jgi:hypothetical protein
MIRLFNDGCSRHDVYTSYLFLVQRTANYFPGENWKYQYDIRRMDSEVAQSIDGNEWYRDRDTFSVDDGDRFVLGFISSRAIAVRETIFFGNCVLDTGGAGQNLALH